MINLFVKTEHQKTWLQRLHEKEAKFKTASAYIDEMAIFPKENIQDLVRMGYTSIALPKAYGGEGLKVYDMAYFKKR